MLPAPDPLAEKQLVPEQRYVTFPLSKKRAEWPEVVATNANLFGGAAANSIVPRVAPWPPLDRYVAS